MDIDPDYSLILALKEPLKHYLLERIRKLRQEVAEEEKNEQIDIHKIREYVLLLRDIVGLLSDLDSLVIKLGYDKGIGPFIREMLDAVKGLPDFQQYLEAAEKAKESEFLNK